MRAAQASPLSRAWLRRQACGCGGGRAWEGQYRTRGEPSFYDVLAGLPGFAKRSERGVKGHRHEVGRHPVRHRVKGLAEVAPDVGDLVDLAQLQAVANRFRDLGWGDVFIAGPVSDRVDHRDGLPDPPGGPASHRSLLGCRFQRSHDYATLWLLADAAACHVRIALERDVDRPAFEGLHRIERDRDRKSVV